MTALVDTNVLVYRYDPRYPEKQAIAHRLVREGLETASIVLVHQNLVELFNALTRPRRDLGGRPLREPADTSRLIEDLVAQLPVLYPNDDVLRLAVRGHATYHLSWWDAHIWAYAEHYELSPIWSEDFEHGRIYGRVQVLNPFLAETVHEPRLPWG